ncbi:MAG: hypothetical protein RR290_03680, partial [Clostridia bacterium]
MKKFFLMLVLCSSFIFCTNGVYADSLKKGDLLKREKGYTIKTDGLTFKKRDIPTNLSISRYNFSSPNIFDDGVPTIGYCLDSNLQNGKELSVYEILGEPNKTEYLLARDYGLLEILKFGFNKYNVNNGFSFVVEGEEIRVKSNDLIQATSIAIRAYDLGLYKLGAKDGSIQPDLTSTYVNEGIHWASLYSELSSSVLGKCENSVNDYAKSIICHKGLMEEYKTWYNNEIIFDHGTTSDKKSYQVIYAAQKLFIKGLEAAKRYKDNGAPDGQIKVTEISSNIVNNAKDDKIIEDKIINFNIKNLSKDGSVTNVNVACEDCASKGISLSFPSVFYNGNWNFIKNTTDISKLVDGNGNVQIKFTATKTRLEECTPASYKVNYKVVDPNSEYSGVIAADKDHPTGTQRYLILVKNDKEQDKSYEGTIKCSKESCETIITTPVCSDEKDGVATITAPENIKKCILNNIDDAGNTYQLSSSNGGVDNDYCEVFCKEDYASITLNRGISDVKCGGYFKLKASIKGNKDCYTSSDKQDKSINKERYLVDIERVQLQLVNAMNRYYKYNSMNNASVVTNSRSFSCGNSTCSERKTITVKWSDYNFVSFRFLNENGSYNMGTESGGASSWSDECDCDNCGTEDEPISCCGGCNDASTSGYNEWKTNVVNGLSRAKSDLIYYQNQYKNIISNYNSCTTVWTNEFKFEQK